MIIKTVNYGFMRLSCPSGIPSYPAISKCRVGPELIRTCSQDHRLYREALGGQAGARQEAQALLILTAAPGLETQAFPPRGFKPTLLEPAGQRTGN